MVLVTGNKGFIKRHHNLFKAISLYVDNVECLPYADLHQVRVIDIITRAYYKIIDRFSLITASRFWKYEINLDFLDTKIG